LIGRTAHSPDSKGHALAFVNAENGSLFPSLIALLRQANVTSKKIPKEIYQTIAATRIKTSISHVQDESKRAFRILSHQEMSIKPNEWHKWQKFTTGSNKMKRRRLTS
jgi:hypothetical protein